MYTYVKAITSNVWCRVDWSPLDYYDEKHSHIYIDMSPSVACNTATAPGGSSLTLSLLLAFLLAILTTLWSCSSVLLLVLSPAPSPSLSWPPASSGWPTQCSHHLVLLRCLWNWHPCEIHHTIMILWIPAEFVIQSLLMLIWVRSVIEPLYYRSQWTLL